MVAVLLVFANHLCGWPRGGFIGVDVFFVISGFLITGNLLRMAENTGNVSFRKFYWNRVRRIVPAATVVLILTYLSALLIFQPFRADRVGVDALFAFIFMSNWWFAIRSTDYFSAGDAVSPIQHYWSLSIEEQFYFVWPALIFVIGLIVARKAWTHDHRIRLTGTAIGAVIAVSLGWAFYESASSPAWAYFDTFARVWELGIGALLATMVGALARIPLNAKPWLSWGGLALIGVGVVLISEGSRGFPAPWALLPVAGSAMVIAAGVGGEPLNQGFLSNHVAVYIGNISYSLYLVHWPMIVMLGVLMAPAGASFYVTVVALAFALAIMSYHFVENPLRYGSVSKLRGNHRRGRAVGLATSTRYAAVGALALLTLGLTAAVLQTPGPPNIPPQAIGGDGSAGHVQPKVDGSQPVGTNRGPLEAALEQQIAQALDATQWPTLEPSMESVIGGAPATPEVAPCGFIETPNPGAEACTWGSPEAAVRIVLVGDSMAMTYAGPLREIALNSEGNIQLRVMAGYGCPFANDPEDTPTDRCQERKQEAVDVINNIKPDVVIISDNGNRADSMPPLIDKFRASTKKIAFLAPPPPGKNPNDCYSTKSSVPADCVSTISATWFSQADDEQDLANAYVGLWIDSSPWFCNDEGVCPAFVGSIPTRMDEFHMTPDYGKRITPVIGEALTTAGVF